MGEPLDELMKTQGSLDSTRPEWTTEFPSHLKRGLQTQRKETAAPSAPSFL